MIAELGAHEPLRLHLIRNGYAITSFSPPPQTLTYVDMDFTAQVICIANLLLPA